MKYIDLPLPKTALETLIEWFGVKDCLVSYAVTDDFDLNGNEEFLTRITITNHSIVDEIEMSYLGKDVVMSVREGFKIQHGQHVWSVRGGKVRRQVGNRYWSAVVCNAEDVARMLASDAFLEIFEVDSCPEELSRALKV